MSDITMTKLEPTMTATDELLTLLKEQGFEHYRHEVPAEDDCVAFYDGNRWHDCWESVDGEVNVTFSMTPQEAIAATIGDTDATPTRHGDVDLAAENVKLRELCADMWPHVRHRASMCATCELPCDTSDECLLYEPMQQRMRELGIEVDG